MIIGGLSYLFNNSSASTIIENFRTTQAIKKKQKIIKTNLTNYLNTVTKDGTVSVSFYNLGAESGSSAASSKYAKLYQAGSLETESNAHAVKTAASTYKLYLTAYLMNQKQNGDFSWTAENTDAFSKMIVNSENDFAEAQLEKYGASTISSFIKKQGWYPSVFQEGQAAKTTSYSLQLLLKDLATGNGVFENKSDQTKILDLMGQQIYRTGIPTGANAANAGTTVQDKVGFLNDTNNDAGIVTLPNGQRYILVVMTNGHNQSGLSGFSRIAEITKNVQKIVYGSDAGTKIENYS
ncbi:MAG TPA: class A beta-lactamase-related serine hydrolase [Candidatus Companilactobacillus pullicola]|uniref:Class A beta-lactamase-related serine hydrolase n=1 Tax=Candidatus Companilactobacillus pullicola TaxID=2838523 RepID=A0A9D1ZSW8_9LACO|nr:class A beta-lactamase-related serine hydrolase [Candidatus Companilactobacillus pullicola]